MSWYLVVGLTVLNMLCSEPREVQSLMKMGSEYTGFGVIAIGTLEVQKLLLGIRLDSVFTCLILMHTIRDHADICKTIGVNIKDNVSNEILVSDTAGKCASASIFSWVLFDIYNNVLGVL